MLDIKEKDPAAAGTATEPKRKSIYEYDNTEPLICQALRIGALAAELGATAKYSGGVFTIEPKGDVK